MSSKWFVQGMASIVFDVIANSRSSETVSKSLCQRAALL